MRYVNCRLFLQTLSCVVLTLMTASWAAGQGRPGVPKEGPPTITLAGAKEEGGEVVVRVSVLQTVGMAETVNGKKRSYFALDWFEGRPMTLGKQVRAYHPDGKPADGAAVLKALGKPAAAACFVRAHPPAGAEPQLDAPDPFYLRVLREGTMILVYSKRDASAAEPMFGPSGANPTRGKNP